MIKRIAKGIILVCVLAAVGATAYMTRARWQPIVFPKNEPATKDEHDEGGHSHGGGDGVELSDLAQSNLKLVTQPIKVGSHWKTIDVPGVVIDRPGAGDRSVVSPVSGVVKQIHRVAGDWPKPGETLFTISILSESFHQAQTDLFKTTQDRKLAEEQKARLAKSGVPEARVIEVEQQISRFDTLIRAYRQDLINRGLNITQIDGVCTGTFVNEFVIATPSRADMTAFELQEVNVNLGQQITAGQTLCVLANHHVLAIEGRAFRDEAPLIERAMANRWPVAVDFGETAGTAWPNPAPTPAIVSVSNVIDPEQLTFRFLLPFDNQAKSYSDKPQVLWRYRPGQRVRLKVRVEEMANVIVLPAEAVVQDGAEWVVFRQNGDRFDRKPVFLLERSKDVIVIANDGRVSPGVYVAQNNAAQLLRMLKVQSNPVAGHSHSHDH